MIPSKTTASFFHGSVHDKSSVLFVLVDDMALGPPIHWIIFIVVGVINLVLPINLLDGLRWGGGIYGSIASCSFGGTFVETIFLDEGFPSFCLPFFDSFSVDC